MKKILPRLPIKKLLKNYGINRISDEAVEELTRFLEIKLISIVKECINYAKIANRRTLLKEDIELWKRKKLLER